MNPLLQKSPFDQLKDKNLFFSVQVDVGGYGISWNDFIDLSEYELYVNSKEVATIQTNGKTVLCDEYCFFYLFYCLYKYFFY